ncbi:unnamed protein product, partial [Brassica oleracea var. botrytis]
FVLVLSISSHIGEEEEEQSPPSRIVQIPNDRRIGKSMTTRNLVEPSWRLLAASGGDTVKLFDVSAGAESCDDPCVLSYTPTPRSVVNSVKWNHTRYKTNLLW